MATQHDWTDYQLCPVCGTRPHSCDWCDDCDIELGCAQTESGLAAATPTIKDGHPALILAATMPTDNLRELISCNPENGNIDEGSL